MNNTTEITDEQVQCECDRLFMQLYQLNPVLESEAWKKLAPIIVRHFLEQEKSKDCLIAEMKTAMSMSAQSLEREGKIAARLDAEAQKLREEVKTWQESNSA